jgi:hypothetical protein
MPTRRFLKNNNNVINVASMTLVCKMIFNAHKKCVIAMWNKVVGGSEAQQGWSLHVKQSSMHIILFCGDEQSSGFGVYKSKAW